MANPVRGEVLFQLGEQTHTLCLTLGGLAEIEALCADDRPMDARRLRDVLLILLRGGGSGLSRAALDAAPLSLGEAADAVARCFEAAR